MNEKNYYPVGTYQIIRYDSNDEVIDKRPHNGCLREADELVEKMKDTCASISVLRVVRNTKYNHFSPKS